jgi:hypothetical protein
MSTGVLPPWALKGLPYAWEHSSVMRIVFTLRSIWFDPFSSELEVHVRFIPKAKEVYQLASSNKCEVSVGYLKSL